MVDSSEISSFFQVHVENCSETGKSNHHLALKSFFKHPHTAVKEMKNDLVIKREGVLKISKIVNSFWNRPEIYFGPFAVVAL